MALLLFHQSCGLPVSIPSSVPLSVSRDHPKTDPKTPNSQQGSRPDPTSAVLPAPTSRGLEGDPRGPADRPLERLTRGADEGKEGGGGRTLKKTEESGHPGYSYIYIYISCMMRLLWWVLSEVLQRRRGCTAVCWLGMHPVLKGKQLYTVFFRGEGEGASCLRSS